MLILSTRAAVFIEYEQPAHFAHARIACNPLTSLSRGNFPYVYNRAPSFSGVASCVEIRGIVDDHVELKNEGSRNVRTYFFKYVATCNAFCLLLLLLAICLAPSTYCTVVVALLGTPLY